LYLDVVVFDLVDIQSYGVILSNAIFEHLTEAEERGSLQEEFGDDTSQGEDIHRIFDPTRSILDLTCGEKSFWCYVTDSSEGGIKIE
jgi:hypothetical protein